ncbi:universal stress protein [Balneolales bacterium ANBcel1]|nr:universal stress protein [Balneolales bacterium ANBcel1]
MLKKAFIPVSLKEPEARMEEMAEYLGLLGTDTVCFCHIVEGVGGAEPDSNVHHALAQLEELFKRHDFRVSTATGSGGIASNVCRLAVEEEADYIAIPWKRKNVIKRAILSSPDIDILRMCSFTTLIHKSRRYSGGDSGLSVVLYATDCKEADKKVLPLLKRAPWPGSHLKFLHVRDRAPDPETDAKREREMRIKMERLAEACHGGFKSSRTELATGSIRRKIARVAKSSDAGLVIVGRNEKKKPLDNILGSNAESLPHRVNSSLLIVAEPPSGI